MSYSGFIGDRSGADALVRRSGFCPPARPSQSSVAVVPSGREHDGGDRFQADSSQRVDRVSHAAARRDDVVHDHDSITSPTAVWTTRHQRRAAQTLGSGMAGLALSISTAKHRRVRNPQAPSGRFGEQCTLVEPSPAHMQRQRGNPRDCVDRFVSSQCRNAHAQRDAERRHCIPFAVELQSGDDMSRHRLVSKDAAGRYAENMLNLVIAMRAQANDACGAQPAARLGTQNTLRTDQHVGDGIARTRGCQRGPLPHRADQRSSDPATRWA